MIKGAQGLRLGSGLGQADMRQNDIRVRCGFGSAPRMARAFERVLGMAPRDYRVMFAGGAARAARSG